MERGLDQLIFFAFIVLAALVDWVVRVIRNRNAPPPPPVEDAEDPYFEDEAEYPEQVVDAPPPRAPAPVAREVVFDAPLPAEWRRIVEMRGVPVRDAEQALRVPEFRPPQLEMPPRLPVQPPLPRPAARAPSENALRWRREALGLKAPGAAPRGIVMMAVLGPCRALEDQPRW